jgi:hypothetical protein
MDTTPQRLAFAEFLRRLAAGRAKPIEWSRFILVHYPDDGLESIRREIVRLAIGRDGGVQWSDSECAALQHWSRELRGV